MSTTEHTAAILLGRGKNFTIGKRVTPIPGPNEVLIESKAIAINPIDHIQRSMGVFVSGYPAVLGSDVAGIVLVVGDAVKDVKVGDRVVAFAPCFFKKGSPNYGAFQEKVLVPDQYVTPLPDSIAFTDAAMLPMAVSTGWLSFFNLGIPKETLYKESDKKGILIWSVASSVGSATLQIAKSMGFHVYATASAKHHEYLLTLGNGPGKVTLFDYNDKDIVTKIVLAAQGDGIVLDMAILATGSIDKCVQILKKSKADRSVIAKIASIPWSAGLLWWNMFPTWGKTSVKFVEPLGDDEEKKVTYAFMFNTWLKEKLIDGGIVPSPKSQILKGGISDVQQGLVEWKKGVSGTKVVIEI